MANPAYRADVPGRSPFDDIRHDTFDEQGNPLSYWVGQELADALGYSTRRNFLATVERARLICTNSGHNSDEHFRMVATNNPGQNNRGRPGTAVHMTRYGCYLTAMCGDQTKRPVAMAMRYFAVQTRRAEVQLPPLAPPGIPLVPASSIPSPQPVSADQWVRRFRRTFAPHVRELHARHPGCFTVVSAVVSEILVIEYEIVRHQMSTRSFDRPDVSIGLTYASHRRGIGMAAPVGTTSLFLPDQDLMVEVTVYAGAEWPEFQRWFRDCYLVDRLPLYLHRKPELRPYLPVTRGSAADNACRELTGRDASLAPSVRTALTAAGGFAPHRALPPGSGSGSPPALGE